MKILILNVMGTSKLVETNILPRVGDNVDMFYSPTPKVIGVLLYPAASTIKDLSSDMPLDIDVIVTVS